MKNNKVKIIPLLLIGILVVLPVFLTGCMHKIPEDPHTFMRTIFAGGLERTYRIHIPSNLSENSTPALIFVLHGGGGTGEGMERSLTLGGFNTLADQHNAIVVYPMVLRKTGMTDEKTSVTQRISKRSMMSVSSPSLLRISPRNSHIDPHRIFATGISNGAMMSYRLAIEISEKIAAIAPVAGAMPIDLLSYNISDVPVSVCVLSGTQDPLVPWEGGLVGFPRNPRGIVLSVPESVLFWVTYNNCSTPQIVHFSQTLTQRITPGFSEIPTLTVLTTQR